MKINNIMNDGENEINDIERNNSFNGRQTLRIIFGKKYEEEITEKIRKIKDNSTRITKRYNLWEKNDINHYFRIKTYTKKYNNDLE